MPPKKQAKSRLTVAVGCDHRGLELKNLIAAYLKTKLGLRIQDCGTDSEESTDYPDFAFKTAQAVSKGYAKCGIVICHSGIGVSVAANKVRGIRAALCHSPKQAEFAKQHTDANILALPAGFVSKSQAKEIVNKWLQAKFEKGRHERRLKKISDYETRKGCKP